MRRELILRIGKTNRQGTYGTYFRRGSAVTLVMKILLADQHAERAAALTESLESCGYEQVVAALVDGSLPARVAAERPDVVLIDVDAPGPDTLEQIAAINQALPCPIIVFSREQDRTMIGNAVRAGATAYIVDGVGAPSIRPIIDAAIATFHQMRELREELDKTRSTLSDRKIIDRAKGILMSRKRMSEEKAYKALQKMAMDSKRKISAVAADVISMAGLLTPDDDRCTEAE